MTDRERIEKTYAKVKKKYPNVVNKDEIDALAIKQEKRFSLLCCLGLVAGAILCFVIGALIKSETYSETRYVLFVTGAFQVYEIFKILAKNSKIEKMYKPVETVTHQGVLTRERILKDGKKLLKKAEGQFEIVKLPLKDKEDDTQVGLDNMTYHVYRFYFETEGSTFIVETNRNAYMDAAIGAMYYVVLTPEKAAAAAYQASNWDLDAALIPLCQETEKQEEKKEMEENTIYEPAPVVQTAEKEKSRKLLPILAMVLAVGSFFTIILLGVPMAVAALVLAIVALTRQRSRLSVASMIVTAAMFVLMVLSVVATFSM